MTDNHTLPLDKAVQNETDRIYRAVHMRGQNGAETVVDLAAEIVRMRQSLTALKQEV